MRKIMFALAAASALPWVPTASAQVPAQIQVETVQPLSGDWTYRAIAGGSEADFIDASAIVRVQVKCNRTNRMVSIVRSGVPAAAPTMTFWTTSLSRTVPARFLPTKELVADLASTDPLLDSIAFSRGRFATAAAGAPMVAVPSAAEVTRVIEDCRS
jgi:hypothetical protein